MTFTLEQYQCLADERNFHYFKLTLFFGLYDQLT